MKAKRIKQIMLRQVESVEVHTSIITVAKMMAKKNIGSLIVVRDFVPVGIITEKQFVELIAQGNWESKVQTAEEIMTSPLISVTPETPTEQAMYLIEKHQIKRMPVVMDNKLVGLITLRDLLVFSRNSMVNLVERTKELQEEVFQDSLTGLYNQRYFIQKAKEEFERNQRYGLYSSLIFFDVDQFKNINDTYSHLAGDYVLETISNIFKSNTRTVDIIARYGGEEFVVIVPSVRLKKAAYLANKLRAMIEEFTFHFNNVSFNLTISAGVAPFTVGKDFLTVINHADEALYHSKRNGRNQVSIWDSVSSRFVKVDHSFDISSS